jgi:acetyl esterase/lipase
MASAATVQVGQTAPQEFALWPGGAPGSETWTQKYGDFAMFGQHAVYNVVQPTLTAYFPDPKNTNGVAVIVAPGGGFRFLTIDNEGTDVAKWLAARGVTAFVLKYRTEKMPDGTIDFLMAFRKFASDLAAKMEKGKTGTPMSGGPAAAGDLAPENPMDWPFTAPADGRQAVKILRANADRWHIAPDKIGLIGFSAGAALTYSVITSAPDAEMPNFAAAMYYTLSPDVPIPANAPPLFMAANAGDPISRGMPGVFQRWRACGHDAEIHMFPGDEHGFGKMHSGKPSDGWIDALGNWITLQTQP